MRYFECYYMFLGHSLPAALDISSISQDIVLFYFHFWKKKKKIVFLLLCPYHLQMIKQRPHLFSTSLNQLSKLNIGFALTLFQLIVFLKPDFTSCNSFTLPLVDKVTKGAQSFVPLVTRFVGLVAEEITQFADQIRIKLIDY